MLPQGRAAAANGAAVASAQLGASAQDAIELGSSDEDIAPAGTGRQASRAWAGGSLAGAGGGGGGGGAAAKPPSQATSQGTAPTRIGGRALPSSLTNSAGQGGNTQRSRGAWGQAR